jgi:acetyl-CoA carboxylase carboxyltransferase component
MAIMTQKDDGTIEAAFTGCVVKTFWREERVMSDVYANVTYAVVFNAEKSTFEEVQVRAHFELDSGKRSAVVDASDDIKLMYDLHQAIKESESKLSEMKQRFASHVVAVKAPAEGRTVKVVKGRKVPVGTVGRCEWIGESAYGAGVRVKIQEANGAIHWTAASNCEAIVGVRS